MANEAQLEDPTRVEKWMRWPLRVPLLLFAKTEKLQKKSSGHLSSFAIALGEAFGHNVNTSGMQFAEKTTEAGTTFANEIKDACKILLENINATQPVFNSASQTVESSLLFIENAKSFIENIRINKDDFESTREVLALSLKSMHEMCSTMNSSTNDIKESIQNTLNLFDEFQKQNTKEINNTLSNVTTQIQNVSEAQQNVLLGAEKLQQITEKNLNTIAESLKTMNDSIGSNLKAADDALGKAVNQLSSAVDTFSERNAKERNFNIRQLNDMQNTFTALHTQLHTDTTRLETLRKQTLEEITRLIAINNAVPHSQESSS